MQRNSALLGLCVGMICDLCAARAHADDCNSNGIDDSADLAGVLLFEGPRAIGTVNQAFGGLKLVDVDGNGIEDLVLSGGSDESVAVFKGLGAGLFGSPQIYPVPSIAQSVDAGDLDGDGDPDLVVFAAIHHEGPGFVVLENFVGERYARGATYLVDGAVGQIATVDLNRDGILDVLVRTADGIAVLLGEGNANFGPPTYYVIGDPLTEFSIGDVNLDGSPDVIIGDATFSATFKSIYQVLNNGDGTFQPATIVGQQDILFTPRLFDLDRDGDLDIIGLNSTSDTMVVIKKGSAGNFGPGTKYTTSNGPVDLDIADLDGDGDLDVAVCSWAGGTNTDVGSVSLFFNSGNAAFEPARIFGLAGDCYPLFIRAADMDEDGDADLLVPCSSDKMLRIFTNDGRGTFVSPDPITAIDVGQNPFDVIAGDLDGDGVVDTAVLNRDSGSISVILSLTDATRRIRTDYPNGGDPRWISAGDLDEDGKLDLVTAVTEDDAVSVFFNDGLGGYGNRTDYPVGRDPYSVTIADLNNDGHLDIVSANHGSFSLSLLINDGTGTFTRGPTELATHSYPSAVVAADFNGDGHTDLAAPSFFDDVIKVFLNAGSGAFATPFNVPTAPNPVNLLAVDLDSDGTTDLVAVNSDYAAPRLSVMLNSGDATFRSHVDYEALDEGSAHRLVATDFNHDGILDIAEAGTAVGDIGIYTGLGGGDLSWRTEFAVADDAATALAIADLDDDLLPDLLVTVHGSNVLRLVHNFSIPPSLDFNDDRIPDECQCLDDFNRDRQVDLNDLGVVLSGFGCHESNCRGDINEDGQTDLADLGHLLSAYGTTCP